MLRRAAHLERHHDERPAVEKCAPHFPDGEIECRAVEECPHVAFAKCEPRLRRREKAGDIAMRDAAALWFAGAAAGVEHVAELRAVAGLRTRIVRSGGDVADADDARGVLWQTVGERALGEEHRRACIIEHEGEALRRIRKINREVGGVCLEDSEQSHDEVGSALHAQADDALGPDAETCKMCGDCVRAGVQLRVGDPRFALDECCCIRSSDGLGGEEFVQCRRVGKLRFPIFTGDGFGLHKLRVFLVGEHWKAGDRIARVERHCAQQRAEMPEHSAHGGLAESRAIKLGDEAQ